MMHFKKETYTPKKKEEEEKKNVLNSESPFYYLLRQHWSREKREKLSILTVRIQTPKDKL